MKNNTVYLTQRVIRKMNMMLRVPVTLVHAPAGFGKTTVVKAALRQELPDETRVFWIVSEPGRALGSWLEFCSFLSGVDAAAAAELRAMSIPSGADLDRACEIIETLNIDRPTYLVVDNLQHMRGYIPEIILLKLLENRSDKLHFIFLTQALNRRMRGPSNETEINYVDAQDLVLDAQEIREFYALYGYNITLEYARKVYEYTEGWILAVKQQIKMYKESEDFRVAPDSLALMQRLVWDISGKEEREFLLLLAPFESIDLRQAKHMLGCTQLPDYVESCLSLQRFVRLDWQQKRYYPHRILRELLKVKMADMPQEQYEQCMRRAGDWYRQNNLRNEAIACYYATRDYDAILAMRLHNILLEEAGDIPFSQIALEIAGSCRGCKDDRQFVALLQTAYVLVALGQKELFCDFMERLYGYVAAPGQAGEDGTEKDRALLGEWKLIHAFRHFPNLREMTGEFREAQRLIKGVSRVLHATEPLFFGVVSPLNIFYRNGQSVHSVVEALTECMEVYQQLTGSGRSLLSLLEAEVLTCRGDMDDAEISAYVAGYEAEREKQPVLRMAASMLLTHIELQRLDSSGYRQAVMSLENVVQTTPDSKLVFVAGEIIRGQIIDRPDNRDHSRWLGKYRYGEFSVTLNCSLALSRLNILLEAGSFARLIGEAQVYLKDYTDYRQGIFGALIRLCMACGYAGLGNNERCRENVLLAAGILFPQRIYYAHAASSAMLFGSVEEVAEVYYPEALPELNRMHDNFERGNGLISDGASQSSLLNELTKREYEVARLASQGLRNREIALTLFISEKTVRAHLTKIFQKLQIDRRARLPEFFLY